jgi:hypothetical protein
MMRDNIADYKQISGQPVVSPGRASTLKSNSLAVVYTSRNSHIYFSSANFGTDAFAISTRAFNS